MIAAFRPAADREELPCPRAAEARLLAIRPRRAKRACRCGSRLAAGRHRAAELRTADCVTGACALGLGRPVILISRAVADALSDESLDEIVMHEQAHLDRYDDWSQLLLAVVGSLVGLHPAVRFLARRLDVDREAACDDRVVSCTGATRRYASALLAVAAASILKRVGSSSPPACRPRRRRRRRCGCASAVCSIPGATGERGSRARRASSAWRLWPSPSSCRRRWPRPWSSSMVADRRPSPGLPPRRPSPCAARRSRRADAERECRRRQRAGAAATPHGHPSGASDRSSSRPKPAALAASRCTTPGRSRPARTTRQPHHAGGRQGAGDRRAVAVEATGGPRAPAIRLRPHPGTPSGPPPRLPPAVSRARAAATGARARSAGISIGRFVTRASKAGASVF